MSVYTRVSRDELSTFLRGYSVGELVDFEGISAGIENTNYFVNTTAGSYVLTLFEQHPAEELPWFLDLMHHLSAKGVPSADPIADQAGNFLLHLCGKPAALVQRLRGKHVPTPNQAQCRAIGLVLAELHIAGQSFTATRSDGRSPSWAEHAGKQLLPKLPAAEQRQLQTELQAQAACQWHELPSGVIHADLFHDNALFEGNHVSGVIDFYYACNGQWLYDLAVVVNDWCSQEDGDIDTVRCHAFLEGYQEQRTLSPAEQAAWPMMLRRAALRFWLSRLQDQYSPREGELTQIKDPAVFGRILAAHQQRETALC